jgi:hypothetical protein
MPHDREILSELDERYLEAVERQNDRIREYLNRIALAKPILADLQAYLDDHGEVAPDDVTWADVGSMARLLADLRDIQRYIRNLET